MIENLAKPLAAAALASLLATGARAAPLTYRFTGTIEETTIAIPGIPAGSNFSGSFTYDPAGASLGGGLYDSVSAVDGTVAGLSYASTTRPGIRDLIVTNGAQDRLFIDTYAFTPFSPYNTGPTIGQLTPYYLALVLDDSSGQAFGDTSIPATLSLASFTSSRFYFNWLLGFNSQESASGSLTSLELVGSPTAVLEPSAWALSLVGAGAIALLVRRRRTTKV